MENFIGKFPFFGFYVTDAEHNAMCIEIESNLKVFKFSWKIDIFKARGSDVNFETNILAKEQLSHMKVSKLKKQNNSQMQLKCYIVKHKIQSAFSFRNINNIIIRRVFIANTSHNSIPGLFQLVYIARHHKHKFPWKQQFLLFRGCRAEA